VRLLVFCALVMPWALVIALAAAVIWLAFPLNTS